VPTYLRNDLSSAHH